MRIVFERGGTEFFVEFDATVTAAHASSATVTEHPVESGANVSDHVRPGLDRISVEAVVTNTPLETPRSHADGAVGRVEGVELDLPAAQRFVVGASGSQAAEWEPQGQEVGANVLRFDQPFNRPRAVYEELRGLSRTGELLRIETDLRDYEQMVIVSLSAPEEAVDAITFSFDAVQIRLAESEIVDVPVPREVRGERTRNRGTQPATQASPEDRTSVLRQFTGLLL